MPFAFFSIFRHGSACIAVLCMTFLALAASGASAQTFLSVKGSSVNVREQPNMRSAVLWELGNGYPLQVQQRQGQWLKVRDHEASLGWIHQSLTSKTPHRVVTARIANLRAGPSEKHRSLGRLERDEVVRTLTQSGQWVQVQNEEGKKGWVARRLTWGW